MNLPVLPSSSQLTTPAQIIEIATALVAWAEQSDDVAAVKDAAAKWAAMTEYVRRTSREGVAEAEAALILLETRVGQLIGAAVVGAHSSASEGESLTPNARSQFRQMAAHRDVVERVIAESTDSNPPSRAKVLREIKAQTLGEQLKEDAAWSRDIVDRSGLSRVDAARRTRILNAISTAHKAMKQLAETVAPDDIEWLIATMPPKLEHLSTYAVNEMHEIALFASLIVHERFAS